ncbi:sensor histidine kinase RegB [Yoonia sp. R2331]|uniref:sensor histidine kinase RegB n=1 Tax=Yoonia sp. R2331 TaxID=3237238 RepID=UPI0034E568F6
MPTEIHDVLQERERSNWVRLRTLVLLRWFAITGQIIAIFVAVRFYGLRIEVPAAALTIIASVLANLFFSFLYPENKRLSEREASFILSFDVVQLGVLLYLTGGLSNPFALLLLAPVTIAATVLHLSSTVVLGILAITITTLLYRTNIPIERATGEILMLPDLFQFGFWVALVIGVIFLAIYARQVTNEMHTMGEALLATQLALAREQKLTDLGGVVAAAAHELGTPLATIKLVSSELIEELEKQPELLEDAALIREQAERCRDILHSMGRAGKDDLHLRTAPLETVVREAAEPHLERGKQVVFYIGTDDDSDDLQPTITRRPEIIHGLRNLMQNAVDFSDSRVEIEATWTDERVTVRISDDGHGFPQSVIGRIGDPFVRRRRGGLDGARRPGYEGMGLGLFIAKTLLERSGAKLTFANGRRHGHAGWAGQATGGAVVTVSWDRILLDRTAQTGKGALGQNQPIVS